MAANDKKGSRRRLRSNADPRLPSRAWTLNRLSGQQAELAWITRRRQAHHLTTPAAPEQLAALSLPDTRTGSKPA